MNTLYKEHIRQSWTPDPELRDRVILTCQDRAKRLLNAKETLDFKQIHYFQPADIREKRWTYIAELVNDQEERLGILKCVWLHPELDKFGQMVKGRSPSIEIFDYRENLKRIVPQAKTEM